MVMTNHEALWQRVCGLVEQTLGVTVGELPMPRIRQFSPDSASMFSDRVPFYYPFGNTIIYVDNEPDRRQLAHEMAHAVVFLAGIKLEDWQVELIPQMVDEMV